MVLFALAAACVVGLRLVRESPVREEGIALLSAIVFFSFFENMLAYTALLGQFVFVVLRGWLSRPPRPAEITVNYVKKAAAARS